MGGWVDEELGGRKGRDMKERGADGEDFGGAMQMKQTEMTCDHKGNAKQ